MILVSEPVYGPFWKLMPKGEKYQSFKKLKEEIHASMQRGRNNQGGEYQSLCLHRQGENTKVGGEGSLFSKGERACLISF